MLQCWRSVSLYELDKIRRKVQFNQAVLAGCMIFPHTFTVLQSLHSHFLFCFLSAFPSCWCLYSSASPQRSSAVDLIRHRLTKGSQCYRGLGQLLPELYQPLPYLHLSSNFLSVLLRKIMQANSNERPYIIES